MQPFLSAFILSLLYFFIGALWYSPLLFGKKWQKETGMSNKKAKKSPMFLIMGASFMAMYIVFVGMIFFLGFDSEEDFLYNGRQGFLVTLLFAIPTYTIHHLYERKSFALWLINCGYTLIALTSAGCVYPLLHRIA